MFSREKYLKKIRPFYNKQLIKVLTGQRRVGKSVILKQIQKELTAKFPEATFIAINKELFEFDYITNYKELMHYIYEKKGIQNFIFIDEVQEISDFEKALRSLLAEGNFDIYCTGSNSEIFSSELATFLSGRQIEIKIHGLSYSEFLKFHKLTDTPESLTRYMKYGGLPYLINLPDSENVIFDYLKNILATILYRDVITRNKVRDAAFFDDLIRFLSDNTGSLVSANKISKYLKSQNISKSTSIIINYLDFLVAANLISKVRRMDVQGKKIFESGEKYYFEDIGLRNIVLGFRAQDINKIMENIVFNHLQLQGYEVFIGKMNTQEVDFMALRDNEIVYIQVAYMLNSEKVMAREFGNLESIADNFPKYVISMDAIIAPNTYKGIRHIHLRDFLTKFE